MIVQRHHLAEVKNISKTLYKNLFRILGTKFINFGRVLWNLKYQRNSLVYFFSGTGSALSANNSVVAI